MFRSLLSFYSWDYPKNLTRVLAKYNGSIGQYLAAYWQTENWSTTSFNKQAFPKGSLWMTRFMRVGILLQVLVGFILIAEWYWNDLLAGWAFGAALVISYPLVWAHILALYAGLKKLLQPKKIGKAILCKILERQVRALRAKHSFKVIAIAGSIGKTSTKVAVAKVLQAGLRVQWQEGNYNDRLTVPLVYFGQTLPGLFNIPAWIKIYKHNKRVINSDYPYDVVVIEYGTDGPGQIVEFAYTKPDIVVVTAITPEHMEYFGTLDTVAAEELTVCDFADTVLINVDDSPEKYLKGRTFTSYGFDKSATYHISKRKSKAKTLAGQDITFVLSDGHSFKATVPLLGIQGAKISLAAVATAHMLGVTNSRIEQGLRHVEPFAGRMRILKGIKKSIIIDDTYNATPVAVNAALDVLYEAETPQRIAILGNMNELGSYSKEAHIEVGEHCDPEKLELVVTIGEDANTYLADAAEKRGCIVERTRSPYEAGKIVEKCLKKNAVILGKGSQNGVFAEEALKIILAKSEDAHLMVRQSAEWQIKKQQQFPLG